MTPKPRRPRLRALTDPLPRLLAPAARLTAALADPARRERAAVATIVGYVLVWTLYGVIAKSSQDVHFDMAELWAWAQVPAFGYPKHPPLAAWLVRGWFAIFPRADWAYYLLAMSSVGVGLWAAWRIAGRWLDGDKRVLVLAVLGLIPLLNVLALKFNPNVVLIPIWALTTLWFLRSLEARTPVDAVLAGLGAAAAMLGKYWSIYLLLGLAAAALAAPDRRRYFGSLAPWLTILAGLLALGPHLAWLVTHNFLPITYASEVFEPVGWDEAATTAFLYLLGVLGYAALPLLVMLLATRPPAAALTVALRPGAPDRRAVWLAFWLPMLLPALVTVLAGGRTTSLWTMSGWALLPVVLLAAPQVRIDRAATVRAVALALAFPLAFLLAAPIAALVIHRAGVPHDGANYRLLADRIAQVWRGTTDRPLRIVGGASDLATGVSFYLPGRVIAFPDLDPKLTPWLDAAQIARDGMALVCPVREAFCVTAIEQRAATTAAAHRAEFELARRYWGIAASPEHYLVLTIPPQ